MRLLTQFFCIATLLYHSHATCFFPNGQESPADTPCNPDAEVSHCCYKNQACLSNGLCVSDPYNVVKARLHRGTCSDKTWKSKDCPSHCTSIADNGVPVYACNQTNVDSYCCFDGCECNASFETFRFPNDDVYTLTVISEAYTNTHTSTSRSASATLPSQASSSISNSKSTTAASVSASATNAGSPSSQNETSSQANEEKSSNSAAIGAGVGVGVGVAIFGCALVAFLFWRRSKKRQQQASNPYDNNFIPDQKVPRVDSTEVHPTPVEGTGATTYAYYAEADPSTNPFSEPQELPVGVAPVELPASPKHQPDYKKRLY